MADELSPNDPENGAYSRRRIDELTDTRFRSIEGKVDEVDRKVDALSNRLAWLFGGLAVLSFVLNILGPVIVRDLVGR